MTFRRHGSSFASQGRDRDNDTRATWIRGPRTSVHSGQGPRRSPKARPSEASSPPQHPSTMCQERRRHEVVEVHVSRP